MALTLDSVLQTRLDSIERQPTIEILSGSFVATIPFEGNSFGISGGSTFRPHLMSLSSGRLGQLYIDSSYSLQYMYTDTTRSQWSEYDLSGISMSNVEYATGTELPDGNIGVVVMTNHYGNWGLQGGVIAPTGAIVTALSEIEDLNDSYDWRAPCVTRLASGTYYLTYIREDPDTAWAIYGRTAAVWGTWGSASDITPSGVNTAREIDNPSLFETVEGDLFLLFDHVTSIQDDVSIKNIFSAISTNDGASFGAATARTNYTAFGSNGLDPVMVQKSNGTVWLIFYENIRVLHMDYTATGFLQSCSYGMGVKSLHCDSANGKIYVVYGNSQIGIKGVGGVAVVDIDTWSIDKVYYNASTPTLNQIFCDTQVQPNRQFMHGDGKYMAIASATSPTNGHSVVAVIDHTADSLTTYVIGDISMTYFSLPDGVPAYGLPRNISYDSNARYGFLGQGIKCIRVDASRDRLYIGWSGGYWNQNYRFSYIDLTEAPDGEGFYNMTWVTEETSGVEVPNDNRTWFEYDWQFELDVERQYIVVYTQAGGLVHSLGWNGGMAVLSEAADGAIVQSYTWIDNNSAPRWGPKNAILYNGALYGSISYCSTWPHTDQRGLVKVDYLTDTITYHRPSFVTSDEYHIYDLALDETNEYIYCAMSYGIARFDINSGAWTLFSDDTLPGFVREGEVNTMGHVTLDAVNGNIIGGAWNNYATNYLSGINMFNENGAYNQIQFATAYKTAAWDWATQQDLSYYSTELQPGAAIDQEDYLWVTWSHTDWEAGINVLYWDNDRGSIALLDDLVDTVTLNWQLKKVNTLSFRLGNGHLYDPQNLLSTFNIVGQKGRKVTIRIGENIGDYTYWVDQGTYLVDTASMSYTRGRDPILSVNCAGKTIMWRQQQVSVSELYSGSMPDDVIRDILSTHTQWLATEYDIPEFESEHEVFYQWIDKTVWEMIEELCDHFFYAMYEDVDGVFVCREVSLTQAVDHEYSDQLQIMDFSPDDNYSDYTNRVRVIGENNDYTEVLHNEELITSRGGTVGWWTKKTDETVHYSEDDTRQCRNPRLEVIHSPKEYGLLLDQLSTGQGGIEISYVDPYEKYLIVEIQCKDLTTAFVGAVIAFVAIGAFATWCGASIYSTCGWYIWAMALAAALVFYILAAMANYQYEIWARPLGRVKSTIQYEANDIEFQRKLNGEIVTEEITDALCNTVTECRRVAEGNLEMIKAQRSRVNFKKIAHMQDELLDKIKVYHPHSGEGMELIVVGVKRTYTKGEGVFDHVEGWRYKP